jgi:exosortase/archaeosortase family protein
MAVVLLGAAAVLAYSGLRGLGGLVGIISQWTKADYSHGFVVVPFALYLLWRNRKQIPETIAWPQWNGVPIALGALGLYLVETKINFAKEWVQGFCFVATLYAIGLMLFCEPPPAVDSVQRSRSRRRKPSVEKLWLISVLAVPALPLALVQLLAPKLTLELLPPERYLQLFFACFAGLLISIIITAVYRWKQIVWFLPALAMLLLALPLPDTIANTVSIRLRELATVVTLHTFRLMGFATHLPTPVKINVQGIELAVDAPCSGLSMLLAFVALTAAIVFLCPPTRRPGDRLLVFLSAIPIAVICNIFRIIASGLVLLAGWRAAFDLIVHDFAGWLMVPVALGFIWLELWLIDWLFVPVSYLSRDEVAKAGFAEARADIAKAEEERKQVQAAVAARSARMEHPGTERERHPAADFLPLTPAGTSHGATATGGTFRLEPTDEPPPPEPR